MSWSTAKRLLSKLPRRSAEAAATSSPPATAAPHHDPMLDLGVFDAEWYVFRYPEVAGFQPHLISHFREYGFAEGRDPSARVSLAKFFERYPEDRGAPVEDVVRRIADLPLAAREDILPDDTFSFEYLLTQTELFDEAWYGSHNPDLAKAPMRLIEHFVAHGATENREPSSRFDAEFYRATYPQFTERSRSAIEDFVRIGVLRGHAPIGPSRYQRWISAFDTLTADDIRRLAARAAALPFPTTALHIMDAEACRQGERIVAAWCERADPACPVHFLRGADVSDQAWLAFAAVAVGKPGLTASGGLEVLSGLPDEMVLLLVHGATQVRPSASVVLAVHLDATGARAAYSDHDHVDAEGARHSPQFKPAMSPEFMALRPYAGRLIAVRLDQASRTGVGQAISAAAEGASEVTMARLLLECGRGTVVRAPFVLFHDLREPRVTEGQVDAAIPPEAARDDTPVSVSLVIPTRNHADVLRACLDSLVQDTDYPADLIEFVIMDNGSDEAEALSYLDEVRARATTKVVAAPGPFNFASICNAGAAQARGAVLVFLNNDMTVNRRDWLSTLVALANQTDVGLVGTKLLYPDGGVQHGGVVLGIQGVGAHRLTDAGVGPAGALDVTRETVAITGACLAVRQSIFNQLGGFDPVLRVAFNDVKLCIAAHEAGLRNIYVGEPLLLHHESKTRGFDDTSYKRHRNAREAIYVRERHEALFRDDPFYSPNLSLQTADRLAMPPRVLAPWRRAPQGARRALLLSLHHGIGYGVAVVLQQQAAFLRDRGWDVRIGGPLRSRELDYEGCQRVDLWTAEAAASYAVAEAIDVVLAHTDPFFSVARFFGPSPLLYFVDHGEPPPYLFADWREREALDWEKRFCAPMARRVFVISETIKASQFRSDAVVVRNGNSHLAAWSSAWRDRRMTIRARLGLDDSFVVLNVCRFGAKDRIYKGVNRYAEVASDLPFLHPEVGGKAHFVLAGRGDAEDEAEMRAIGIDVHANPTDEDLLDLYAASDLYMSFSQWEGYNLGIGQAMAMGLDVIASDVAAHREFGIETSDSIPAICAALAKRMVVFRGQAAERTARIEPWSVPLNIMVGLIEADLAEMDRDEASRGIGRF